MTQSEFESQYGRLVAHYGNKGPAHSSEWYKIFGKENIENFSRDINTVISNHMLSTWPSVGKFNHLRGREANGANRIPDDSRPIWAEIRGLNDYVWFCLRQHALPQAKQEAGVHEPPETLVMEHMIQLYESDKDWYQSLT